MSEHPLHILLLDDNPDDRILVVRALQKEFTNLHIQQVAEAKAFSEALAQDQFDIVITDYRLRWTDGLKVLHRCKARWPNCPVVMFTGTGSEEIAVEAMKAGLDDYIVKSPQHFVRLSAAVHQAIRRAEERRQAHLLELRYEQLMNNLPVGVFRVTLDDRVIECNPASLRLVGVENVADMEQWLRTTAFNVGDSAPIEELLKTLQRQGHVSGWRLQIRRADGKTFWAEIHATLIEEERTGTRFVDGTLEDVTQRVTAETLREAALALTKTLDLDQVIAQILIQLQQVVPYDSTLVKLLEGEQLRIVGGHGFEDLSAIIDQNIILTEDTPNQEAVRTRASFIVADAPHTYKNLVDKAYFPANMRSWMGVPMLIGERMIGLLALHKREADFYTPEHSQLAQAFASQAAVALENSRLFQSEREQRTLAEALEEAAAVVSSTLDLDQVLDRILEQVERIVAGDASNIMLLEDHVGHMVRWRGYKQLGVAVDERTFCLDDYQTLQKMAQDNEPALIRDTTTDPDWKVRKGWGWIRAYLGAPIQVGEIVVGFLNVDGTKPEQFDMTDLQNLEAFAHHAATAIENAQLYRELRKYAGQLEERVRERTAQIQAQYAQTEAILRSASDGLLVVNADGDLLHVNPVAQQWLNQRLSPEDTELLKTTIRELAEQAEDRPSALLELKGTDLQLNAAPIAETNEDRALAVVAIHDISHLKALDRLQSRFASNVSHELRTPITTIKAYLELLRRTPPEKWDNYLNALEQEVNRQERLIEGILQISRIDAGRLALKPRSTPLNHLTETAITTYHMLAQRKNVSLEHYPGEPEPLAMVDPEQIMLMLNNVVQNAIQYTPKAGKVTVATGQRTVEGREWAVVTVTDTGIGISQEEITRIFDRFYRGENAQEISGSGLGLAIAKDIVDLHGGWITVESELDKGTKFTIWLPMVVANTETTV